jgi:hypothetical protein
VPDVRDVPVHSVPTEDELLGDLAVAQPVRDAPKQGREGLAGEADSDHFGPLRAAPKALGS